jgi:hypothetical protein
VSFARRLIARSRAVPHAARRKHRRGRMTKETQLTTRPRAGFAERVRDRGRFSTRSELEGLRKAHRTLDASRPGLSTLPSLTRPSSKLGGRGRRGGCGALRAWARRRDRCSLTAQWRSRLRITALGVCGDGHEAGPVSAPPHTLDRGEISPLRQGRQRAGSAPTPTACTSLCGGESCFLCTFRV